MFSKARSGFPLAIVLTFSIIAVAQNAPPIVPLKLENDPQPTKAPPFAGVSDMQCDGSGTIYVHYVVRDGDSFSFSSGVTKIESDGSVEKVPISALPNTGPVHVFQFAVAEDHSLHEIVRAEPDDAPDASSQIYYVTFDPDGAFHSKEPFDEEFIPSLLLPLPDGDFFATGVTMEEKEDDVEESPLSGIFGPDAKLKVSLRNKTEDSSVQAADKGSSASANDTFEQGGVAAVGADGNIYVLVDGNATKVKVITQSGRMVRELTLRNPFSLGTATGMWISGGMILVTYEGEADDPKDGSMYALYDAQTGQNVRLYRPDFSGSLACFDGGQSVTVLLPQKSSGAVEMGEASLQ